MNIKKLEMEVTNLMIAKDASAVEKLLKTYSTNEELREETVRQLLCPGKHPNGHQRDPLNMNIEVDLKNSKSVSREILEKYLNVLGYSLVDNIKEEGDDESK